MTNKHWRSSRVAILSSVGIGAVMIGGLMTACSLQPNLGSRAQPTVNASPIPQLATASSSLPASSSPASSLPARSLPASRPAALPVPSLIPPVGALPASGNIGGRPDPFSALPLTPTVVIKQNPVAVRPAVLPAAIERPAAPSVPPASAATAQQAPSLPLVTVPATVAPGAAVPASGATVAPPANLPASIPAAPRLNLAEAIAISGVVQAGSRTSVIVQVPNETTSRSAVVGDYLANGKVLVKRIEMQGAEPVVVLEQDGAEFVKPVGSGSLGTL